MFQANQMFGLSHTTSAAVAVIAAAASALAGPTQKDSKRADAPIPGMQTYTRAHATHENPPDLLGGPLEVDVSQHNGVTYFVVPGPRRLDPAVFGTPDKPTGFDPAPFPLLGVPFDKRLTEDGKYTYASQATPFSNWAESGEGSLTMKVVDATAIDGATTKDTINFEANFYAPDGTPFRVTCDEPLPHGSAYPTFGGVVTNHLLHGVTGIGTRLMPTEFTYVAFWGKGKVYRAGTLIADNQVVHVMVTEFVRGPDYRLAFDGGVGEPPSGKTLHLMIPPFKVGEHGLEPSPLMTGYDPFPYAEQRLNREVGQAKMLPEDQRDQRMELLDQVRDMMDGAKEHAKEMSDAGKLSGQPFFHVMFNDFQITAHRGSGAMRQRMNSMKGHMDNQHKQPSENH